ncbi:MAG TPA: penicillin-binding protein 2 [Pilimelia sp.]|nr:penicillin-binding protein 2 [Pilimelia sp.]
MPRSSEPPPGQPRRGAAAGPPEGEAGRAARGRGGIGAARSYTPRGRTVRDRTEEERAEEERAESPRGRTGDPFRPALRVLDGGAGDRTARGGTARRGGVPAGGAAAEADRGRADRGGASPRGSAAAGQRGAGAGEQSGRRSAGTGQRGAGAGEQSGRRSPATGQRGAGAAGRGAGGGGQSGQRSAGVGRRGAGVGGESSGVRRASAAGRSGADARDRPATGGRAAGRRGVPPQRSRAASRSGTGRRPPGPPPQPPPLADPRRRLRVATLLAVTLFGVIGVRLVAVQATDAPAYAAEGLQSRLAVRELPAPRGAIYDRSGAVLAHSVEAKYVYADPTRVENPARTAEKLSPLLGMSRSELLPLLQRKKRPLGGESQFEYLQRGVSLETAERIMALDLAGINVARDERREVPGNDLAANLIGFTGQDLTGLEGMEARYDDLLRGRAGKVVYEQGRGKNLAAPIPGGYRRETAPQPGSSLRLTIDRDVQFEVQRILSTRMREVRATVGAAVVLDVRTGEVVAQASYPAYSAADPLKAKPTDREDVASSAVFDPGSVHKALVVGAALEEGVIRPDSAVAVSPTLRKGDEVFRDTRPFPAGTRLTLPGVMAYSSNVGIIRMADQLGPQKVYDYQLRFGLGKATGVGVPGEAAGLVQPPKNWSGSSYGSIPIGHGVAVTPLQMAAAYAAIANDGTWVQPHLVQAVIGPDGAVRRPPDPQTRQVLSPQNAAALRRIMEAVVAVDGATGTTAAIPGYRVAGKTGTGAQVVGGRYIRGEVASFIGMAPADQPRYVVAVFAHTPGGGGGRIAGPAFREMMAYTLRHFKIPPTGTRAPDFAIHP